MEDILTENYSQTLHKLMLNKQFLSSLSEHLFKWDWRSAHFLRLCGVVASSVAPSGVEIPNYDQYNHNY